MNTVVLSESLSYLRSSVESESVQMIYVDPPFGTGKRQVGSRYGTRESVSEMSYDDPSSEYVDFIRPFLEESLRVLSDDGTICVHLDWRNVHYVRVELDKIFGRENFLNEIIWHYSWGGYGHDRFPQKHDTILVYVKDVSQHVFNWDDIPRIPYMSQTCKPGSRFVTPEKAARGKPITDVWWRSVIGTNSKERTGYPTQKPCDLVERFILMHSSQGKTVLDFFAGSGTTGVAAHNLGRQFTLVDSNLEAVDVMSNRFESLNIDVNFVY